MASKKDKQDDKAKGPDVNEIIRGGLANFRLTFGK
jgi:hypothetical protein